MWQCSICSMVHDKGGAAGLHGMQARRSRVRCMEWSAFLSPGMCIITYACMRGHTHHATTVRSLPSSPYVGGISVSGMNSRLTPASVMTRVRMQPPDAASHVFA